MDSCYTCCHLLDNYDNTDDTDDCSHHDEHDVLDDDWGGQLVSTQLKVEHTRQDED